jgi:hypothetical protein
MELQAVLDCIKDNDFHSAFEAQKKQWDCCIHLQGDYFEGDGQQKLSKLSQHLFFDLLHELFYVEPNNINILTWDIFTITLALTLE